MAGEHGGLGDLGVSAMGERGVLGDLGTLVLGDLGVRCLCFGVALAEEEGVLEDLGVLLPDFLREDLDTAFLVLFGLLTLLVVSRDAGLDLLTPPSGLRKESRLAWERERLREREVGEGLGSGSLDTEDNPRLNFWT